MLAAIRNFVRNENGNTAIEYALIASGIFLAIVTVMGTLGTNLSNVFVSVNDGFN